MKNIWHITVFTLKEMVRTKIFIAFAIIMTLLLLGFWASSSFSAVGDLSPHAPKDIQDKLAMQYCRMALMKTLATAATLGMLLIFFSTLPVYSLLYKKGTTELILSKPLTRGQYLAGRLSGGVLLGLANIFYYMLGVFVICGLQFGYWNAVYFGALFHFLIGILVIYSITGLFAVLFRSPVVGLMSAYLVLMIPPLRQVVEQSVTKEYIKSIFNAAAYVIPDFSKILGTGLSDLMQNEAVTINQPVGTALAFIIVIIGAMILIYEKKDL